MATSPPTDELVTKILHTAEELQAGVRQLFATSQTLHMQVRKEWGPRQREASTNAQRELVDLDVRRLLAFAQTWMRFSGSFDGGLQRVMGTRRLIEATRQDREDLEADQTRQAAVEERHAQRRLRNTPDRRWPEPEDIESLYGKGLVDDAR